MNETLKVWDYQYLGTASHIEGSKLKQMSRKPLY